MIPTESYVQQLLRWPTEGRHILAQFDDESVVVYQAYRPTIGRFAAKHGYFGGEFRFGRMSWIKPNFLWMMFRSGWGTKPDQEVTLAIRLKRAAFDTILSEAVHSTFVPDVYGDEDEWKRAVAHSNVRLQWDPDHDPTGAPLERRAIQLGLRDDTLARFAREWIVAIDDLSDFVAAQRQNSSETLIPPSESVYPVSDPATRKRLGIDSL